MKNIFFGLFFSVISFGCVQKKISNTSTKAVAEGSVEEKKTHARKALAEKYGDIVPGGGLLGLHTVANGFQIFRMLNMSKSGSPLSGDSPLSVKGTAIIEKLHEAAAAAFPSVAAIPPPKVVVTGSGEVNIFNMRSTVCIKKPLQLEGSTPTESTKAGILIASGKKKPLTDECERMPVATAEETALHMKAVNALFPECKLQDRGTHLSIARECSKEVTDILESQGVTRSAPLLGIGIPSNVVIITQGFFDLLEDKHLAFPIAHELAHYYRAHNAFKGNATTWNPNPKSFFYKIEKDRPREIPSPETSGELEALANELRTVSEFSQDYNFIGQTVPVGAITIFYAFCQLNPERPVPPSVRPACDDFMRLAGAYQNEINDPVWLKNATRALATKRKKELDTAASTLIKITPALSMAQWAVRWNTTAELAAKPFGIVKGSVADLETETLQSAIEKHRLNEEALNAKTVATVRRAQEAGLGWYTDEVEADELAVGLLALAGFNPAHAVDSLFRLYQDEADIISAFSPSLSDCRKGYLNNWKHWTFAKRDFVPYFGSLDDTHASACFRVFDADTERISQGY